MVIEVVVALEFVRRISYLVEVLTDMVAEILSVSNCVEVSGDVNTNTSVAVITALDLLMSVPSEEFSC